MVLHLRPKLSVKGYLPITLDYKYRERLLGEDWRTAMEESRHRAIIAVIKASDPYDIVRIQGTDASNFGMGNDDIINELKEWEQLCEFEILGAGGDTLDIAFHTLPEDIESFAADVDNFCPDLMGQGYIGEPLGEDATMEDFERAFHEQTIEDLVEFLQREKRLHFWWD